MKIWKAVAVLALLMPRWGVPQAAAVDTFRDKRLGFTYSLPAGMLPEPGAEAMLKQARQRATVPGDSLALECLTIPVRLKSPTRAPFERFVFFETDFGCLGRDYNPTNVPSFTGDSMDDLVKGYGKLGDAFGRSYLLDNHHADWETNTIAADSLQPGLILYAAQVCIALEHTVACWNFVTSDRGRLHTLADLQFQFDGYKSKKLSPRLRMKAETLGDP